MGGRKERGVESGERRVRERERGRKNTLICKKYLCSTPR